MLEEFEVHGSQRVTIETKKPKPCSTLDYIGLNLHIKDLAKEKLCLFPVSNNIYFNR